MTPPSCVLHRPAEHGPFRHPLNPASEVYGVLLGRAAGLQRTAVNLARLPPGKESFVLHLHRAEEEWLYVLSGAGELQIGAERFAVGPGDFAGFPPTTHAHHLRNAGSGDLVYLSGGENREVEVGEFPGLLQRLVRLPGEATVYPADAGRPLFPGAASAAPGVTPADLLVRSPEPGARDEERFRHPLNPRSEARWRALGERAGLRRVAVTEARLAPGAESYVLHRHAVEEEWLYVLTGQLLLDLGDERVELAPGDFAAFTPEGPPHLVTNPYAAEATYLEGGERVPVDVVEFPRLGKVMVRVGEARTFYPVAAGERYLPESADASPSAH